jgi:uncharacterized protein involved in exopolysaccharide biosynthesis
VARAVRAAKIANTLGQAYIDYCLERRLEVTRGASKWLDERVTEFAQQLETREKELYEFVYAARILPEWLYAPQLGMQWLMRDDAAL